MCLMITVEISVLTIAKRIIEVHKITEGLIRDKLIILAISFIKFISPVTASRSLKLIIKNEISPRCNTSNMAKNISKEVAYQMLKI